MTLEDQCLDRSGKDLQDSLLVDLSLFPLLELDYPHQVCPHRYPLHLCPLLVTLLLQHHMLIQHSFLHHMEHHHRLWHHYILGQIHMVDPLRFHTQLIPIAALLIITLDHQKDLKLCPLPSVNKSLKKFSREIRQSPAVLYLELYRMLALESLLVQ